MRMCVTSHFRPFHLALSAPLLLLAFVLLFGITTIATPALAYDQYVKTSDMGNLPPRHPYYAATQKLTSRTNDNVRDVSTAAARGNYVTRQLQRVRETARVFQRQSFVFVAGRAGVGRVCVCG